jgi:hypothetical protein
VIEYLETHRDTDLIEKALPLKDILGFLEFNGKISDPIDSMRINAYLTH